MASREAQARGARGSGSNPQLGRGTLYPDFPCRPGLEQTPTQAGGSHSEGRREEEGREGFAVVMTVEFAVVLKIARPVLRIAQCGINIARMF